MNKRTLLIAGLLAASVSQAASKKPSVKEDYLGENTGSNQERMVELCLKVTTYSIGSFGPHGPVSSSPIGLIVDNNEVSARDLVIATDRATGDCETGYIKIQTTAKLMSLSNAPIGL